MHLKIIINGVLFFGLLIAGLPSTVAQNYQGTIYLDKNTNGKYDRGEVVLEDIAVSDGLNVVLTDKKGKFKLPYRGDERFIFITVPAGCRPYQSHYQRIEVNPQEYDFGLVEYPRTLKDKFSFIQITDTETYEDKGWVDPIRKYAGNEEVSFIVHTGDICYEKGLNFHGENVTTQSMGLPVYYCIGNHDLVAGEYGEQLFEDNFGPVYYSFDAGKVHFIVTPMLHGDHRPSYTKKDVYLWLKNDLAKVPKEKSVIVFNHDLLTFGDEFIYEVSDREKINLNEHNLKAWIYGHWHINYVKSHGSSNILSVCSSSPDKGGIDHSASNFLVYDIEDNDRINISPRYNYLDRHLVITSPSNDNMSIHHHGKVSVSVNTYHTPSPTKKVRASFDESAQKSEWYELTSNNSWNWSAEIPISNTNLEGEQKIFVEAIYANGETQLSSNAFHLNEAEIRLNTTDTTWPNMLGNAFHNMINRIHKSGSLKLSWMHNTGNYIWMAGPVYADDQVFIATMDEFDTQNNYIISYDAKSGKLLWQFPTGNSVKNSICYEDGVILATDIDGVSYAINSHNGTLKWKKKLGRNYLPTFVSGNVTKDGVLYTGFGNYLTAFDISSGNEIWRNEDWNGGEGTSSTLTVANETLIAGANWRALYGHHIKTGDERWNFTKDGMRFRSSTSCFVEDTLYVLAQKSIFLMDPETGKSYKMQALAYDLQVATTPIVTSKHIIFGTSREGVIALNRNNLKEAWKVKTGESLFYTAPYSKRFSSTVETSPVLSGEIIYFGASDGFLYKVEVNTGEIIERINLGSPILGPACISGDALYVTDFAGNLYAFSIAQ